MKANKENEVMNTEEEKEIDPKELARMQKENLISADEYLPRLIETAQTVSAELAGEQEEDTHDLFNQVIDGVNYIIEIFNGTLSLTNENRITFNTDEVEEMIQKLSNAIIAKDDKQVAVAMQNGMIPFLQKFQVVIKEYI